MVRRRQERRAKRDRAEPAVALKRHWFHILLALAETGGRSDGSDRSHGCHGSGIVEAVLEQTRGGLRLWPAMLYGSLEELAERGLIEELTDAERPRGESQRKRFYRITPAGKRALAAEAAEMAALSEAALRRV